MPSDQSAGVRLTDGQNQWRIVPVIMRQLSLLLILSICGSALAQQPAPAREFEVATIKPSQVPPGTGRLASLREDVKTEPSRLIMNNVSLTTAIRWAYKLGVYEIAAPDWAGEQRYDITATAPGAVSEDQLRAMLQALLADRFKLAVHRQTRDVSSYALVQGRKPKLMPAEAGVGGEGSMTGAGLMFEGHRMPLSRLADILASALKIPVRDMTGLDGYYDFKIDMRPYLATRQPSDGPLDLTSIAMIAIDEQLGLKLESRKLPVDMLIVDNAERKPSDN
jgi:uncharacterized protein (TIGR03435 family)